MLLRGAKRFIGPGWRSDGYLEIGSLALYSGKQDVQKGKMDFANRKRGAPIVGHGATGLIDIRSLAR